MWFFLTPGLFNAKLPILYILVYLNHWNIKELHFETQHKCYSDKIQSCVQIISSIQWRLKETENFKAKLLFKRFIDRNVLCDGHIIKSSYFHLDMNQQPSLLGSCSLFLIDMLFKLLQRHSVSNPELNYSYWIRAVENISDRNIWLIKEVLLE